MPKNIAKIIQGLEKEHGREKWNWHTQQSRFQILIGTVLSQRTKDANTDRAAQQLFSRYKNARELSNAPIKDIEKRIKPSGFYRVKARRIREISKILMEKHKGKVPDDIEDLVKIPGVGYKTAGCVIVYGFNCPEIPVDTHVAKIAQRLGLTRERNPDKIRLDLMKKIPKKRWIVINELFVKHGKAICLSRNPRCGICPIRNCCNYYKDIYL